MYTLGIGTLLRMAAVVVASAVGAFALYILLSIHHFALLVSCRKRVDPSFPGCENYYNHVKEPMCLQDVFNFIRTRCAGTLLL